MNAFDEKYIEKFQGARRKRGFKKRRYMCGRCYTETTHLLAAPCSEKPEKLLGAPIGMYHCPECGAMLIAGLKHPKVCATCARKTGEQ